MILIVGTVRLPPRNLAAARAIMQQMVDASRAETGCMQYCYAEDLFDPGLIHIKELWLDRAALERHFASAHIAAWRAEWPRLGIGHRDLVAHEVAEGRPV